MFSGIIEDLGTLKEKKQSPKGAILKIATAIPGSEVKLGDSIAINGACLTVIEINQGQLNFEVSPETLDKTNFGQLQEGQKVNLERAIKMETRLDGHMVSGHVDDLGKIQSKSQEGEYLILEIAFNADFSPFLIYKGSVAINGISLTINEVLESSFKICLIPHTIQCTNLANLEPGSPVNLEFDMIGKYLHRFYQLSQKK